MVGVREDVTESEVTQRSQGRRAVLQADVGWGEEKGILERKYHHISRHASMELKSFIFTFSPLLSLQYLNITQFKEWGLEE